MNFLKRFFTTAPIIFPLIALFHIGLTAYEAVNYIGDTSVSYYYWLRPMVLALYTLFWLGCCYRKKWGGLGYLLLTIANVAFYFFGPDSLLNIDSASWINQLIVLRRAIGDLLFVPLPANILFSFIILFYYQKMFPAFKKVKTAAPGIEPGQ
jgi:hypothetical protein